MTEDTNVVDLSTEILVSIRDEIRSLRGTVETLETGTIRELTALRGTVETLEQVAQRQAEAASPAVAGRVFFAASVSGMPCVRAPAPDDTNRSRRCARPGDAERLSFVDGRRRARPQPVGGRAAGLPRDPRSH